MNIDKDVATGILVSITVIVIAYLISSTVWHWIDATNGGI